MFQALLESGHYFAQYRFPTYSFKNLFFRLSVFYIFCLFYFEVNVIFYVTKNSVMLFSLYENYF